MIKLFRLITSYLLLLSLIGFPHTVLSRNIIINQPKIEHSVSHSYEHCAKAVTDELNSNIFCLSDNSGNGNNTLHCPSSAPCQLISIPLLPNAVITSKLIIMSKLESTRYNVYWSSLTVLPELQPPQNRLI